MMNKLLIAIALVSVLSGCHAKNNEVRITCPPHYTLSVNFNYSEEEWKQLRKEGKPWTATVSCESPLVSNQEEPHEQR
jgi:hypothetical protein